jgi:putative oxidoreductase
MAVLERWQDQVLGLFRIVVAFMFATHGAAALFGVLGVEKIEPLVWPGWWASAIQAIGGLFVLAGFGTRYAALLCSGSMAYAYFTVHQQGALLPVQNGGEKAALFSFAFLLIAFLGSGAWALEGSPLLKREREPVTAAD